MGGGRGGTKPPFFGFPWYSFCKTVPIITKFFSGVKMVVADSKNKFGDDSTIFREMAIIDIGRPEFSLTPKNGPILEF